MITIFVLLFALGSATHLFGQAQASVMSRSNGLSSVKQWVQLNLHVIIVRVVLGVGSFLLWKESPQIFGQMIGQALPMNLGTCIIGGFCSDAFWDKVTFIGGLKVEIPHLSPPKECDNEQH